MRLTPDILGWKQIADYLNVSVPTATRWAIRASCPLPVCNYGGQKAAYREDLDSWITYETSKR